MTNGNDLLVIRDEETILVRPTHFVLKGDGEYGWQIQISNHPTLGTWASRHFTFQRDDWDLVSRVFRDPLRRRRQPMSTDGLSLAELSVSDD